MKVLQLIALLTCQHFNIRINSLMTKRRFKKYAYARHVFVMLARKHTKVPLKQIGQYLGGRDHATIIHSDRVAHNLYDTDTQFRAKVDEIDLAIIQSQDPEIKEYALMTKEEKIIYLERVNAELESRLRHIEQAKEIKQVMPETDAINELTAENRRLRSQLLEAISLGYDPKKVAS